MYPYYPSIYNYLNINIILLKIIYLVMFLEVTNLDFPSIRVCLNINVQQSHSKYHEIRIWW